jgi:hypothetical protein
VWSVITVVPSGYREFCYNVDGGFTVSRKHPTNAEGTCNWRTVYGPPPRAAPADQPMQWFIQFSEAVAESMLALIAPTKITRRRGADAEAHAKSTVKETRAWVDRPLKVAVISVSLYAAVTIAWLVWKHAF